MSERSSEYKCQVIEYILYHLPFLFTHSPILRQEPTRKQVEGAPQNVVPPSTECSGATSWRYSNTTTQFIPIVVLLDYEPLRSIFELNLYFIHHLALPPASEATAGPTSPEGEGPPLRPRYQQHAITRFHQDLIEFDFH